MLATIDPLTQLYSPIYARTRRRQEMKHCDVCGLPAESHTSYLVHPASRRLILCCDNCSRNLLAGGSRKYRPVPSRVECLPEFSMTDAQWNSLNLPIHLAFFYYSTPDRGVWLVYPDSSGPNETRLPPAKWEELAAANGILRQFQPDVEGLLINRVGRIRRYFRAPIDECFKLTAIVRDNWTGVTGGVDLWRKIEWCFAHWRGSAAN